MTVRTELAAPAFLIAMPQLGDPNFMRAVVFIVDHNDNGSMGLMINRPTDLKVSDLCASQDMRWGDSGTGLVYQGGPVQTERAFILHASDHKGPETEAVMENINLSYSLESLRLMAEQPPQQYRIFLGYAGWGPGQLAEELTAGAWLLGQPNGRLIFNTPVESVWEIALNEMGIDPMQLMHSGAVH
ncbi:MAG: YqgE/AlgH family protein [Deltaproteobacteria bacterium]|nr:YqgE/AlgH family protein [Deltaproteobacteria bacterium]